MKNEIPTIVIVGPTNVGKSTLFNRLTKTRRAIVCDRPGVTVDRHEMRVTDTPVGIVKIVDTGGVGPEALSHPLGAEIERAAQVAVAEADLILFLVDGTREVGIEELEVAAWLRKQKILDSRAVWIVANKSDDKTFDDSSFYMLGFDRVLPISAEHNEGITPLWEAAADYILKGELPAAYVEEKDPEERIVVIGRPNTGKSTLLNQIIGKDRHVVSPIAGTTRDTIETEYKHHGKIWTLCDTAGMRRPGRLERDVEWVAREKLKDAARGARLAILVLDSTEGVTDLDCAIAGMALDFGLSLVICFNKWDQMRGGEESVLDQLAQLERSQDRKLDFVEWCPVVKLSALTGKGISELLKQVEAVLKEREQRVQTSRLNDIFERRLRLHHHPSGPGGRTAKFYYLAQVKAGPPEFVLFSNIPARGVHFSFRRFISNTLRKEFGFNGTPIRLHFKQSKNVQRN